MSFADFAEKWLESRKEELAYSTYIGYVQIVNNKIVPALGQYKVARIKPPVIEEFYKSLVGNLANGSIQKVLALIAFAILQFVFPFDSILFRFFFLLFHGSILIRLERDNLIFTFASFLVIP